MSQIYYHTVQIVGGKGTQQNPYHVMWPNGQIELMTLQEYNEAIIQSNYKPKSILSVSLESFPTGEIIKSLIGYGLVGILIGALVNRCFSKDMLLQVKDQQILMNQVKGNEELKDNDRLIEIQKDENELTNFIRLRTNESFIELTKYHYIYIKNKEWVEAQEVELGDYLINSQNQPEQIISIESIQKIGYFCPKSLTGEIIVNNFKVSCHSSLQCKQLFSHQVSHFFSRKLSKIKRIPKMLKKTFSKKN